MQRVIAVDPTSAEAAQARTVIEQLKSGSRFRVQGSGFSRFDRHGLRTWPWVLVARPIRYTVILVLVALGATLAAVGGWRYARASAPVPGPIILISIDTLRADHLPVYGYRNVTTPAIDALARDGIVFERAYSHSVQTLPAHVALLSGRLPFETGVRDDGRAVKANERLLAQMLRDRGYATGGIVSSGMLRGRPASQEASISSTTRRRPQGRRSLRRDRRCRPRRRS